MRKGFSFCLSLSTMFALLFGPIVTSATESATESTSPKADSTAIEKRTPSHLVFLSGPKGGQWFALGALISEVLNQAIMPTSTRIGGGVANIGDIEDKNGDIGFTLTCFMGAADSGEKEYEVFKTKGVSIIGNVYPQVLYVLLRKDFADKYNIKTIKDLLAVHGPTRFASLKPGTASEFILSMLLKYGYNTNFKQLEKQNWQISFNNYAETADNFVAGELDCFAYTAGTDVPLIKTMEEYLDVLILPVETSVLDALSAKFKTGTYTIQPKDYACVTEPINTLGDYTTLIAQKDLADDVIYNTLKALYLNKEYIANTVIDFDSLSPDTAMPKGLSMHPGAVKFWTELKAKQ